MISFSIDKQRGDHLRIEHQEFGDARHADSIRRAKERVAALADHLIV